MAELNPANAYFFRDQLIRCRSGSNGPSKPPLPRFPTDDESNAFRKVANTLKVKLEANPGHYKRGVF